MIEVHIKVVLVQLQSDDFSQYQLGVWIKKNVLKNTNRSSQTLTEMVSVEVNSRGIN